MTKVRAQVLFAVVPEWILYSEISDRAVRLYGVLARYADRATGKARPGWAELAKRMHCSPDSVDRAMRELVALGAVEITHRFREGPDGGRLRLPNVYLLVASPPSRTAAATPLDADTPLAAPLRPPSRTAAATVAAPVRHEVPRANNERTSIAPPAPTRRHDLVFEAFCRSTGVDWRELSAARRAELNGMLRGAGGICERGADDGTGEEIRRRAARWRQRFTVPLTPETLVRRWAELGEASGTAVDLEQARRDLAFAEEHGLSDEAIAIYRERVEAAS